LTVFAKKDTQSSLLRWVLIILGVLTTIILVVVLIDNPPGSDRRILYLAMVIPMLLLLGISLWLLEKGQYLIPATIVVALPMLGAWGSLLFDPSVGQGDLFPLLYVVFTITLSSLFLSRLATVLIASVQFVLLVGVVSLFPSLRPLNCASFLLFVFVASVLGIVTNQLLESRVEQLRGFAITDALTGLPNRRYFEVVLEQKLSGLKDTTDGFGLILIDIDYFKGLNDTHGHPAGDLVLREFARYLKNRKPFDAIACRIGGDEFAVITNDPHLDTVRALAEKLCKGVAGLALPYQGSSLGPISITLGIAHCPEHGETRNTLFSYADEALLSAKRAGRGRVG
jgi:diguanylate cyclase (GGDEF)-like protein